MLTSKVFAIFLLIFLTCNNNSTQNSNSPIDDFMVTDMKISNCKVIFDNGFYQIVDGKLVDFLVVKSMAIENNSKYLFLLGDNGNIVKIRKDGTPLLALTNHGQGPGQWLSADNIRIRKDKLYIHDLANNKILIYRTDGSHIKTLVFHDIILSTFDVDTNGCIIIPKVIHKRNEKTPLFYKYDCDGKLIEKFSSYSYIEDNVFGTPFPFLLRVTPTSNILLGLRYEGKFYLFDQKGELLNKFDIISGQEWKESLEFEKAFESDEALSHGRLLKIKDIAFDSKGNIYTPWGGNFKGKRTIAMKFSASGEFIGRVFGTNDLFDPPMIFQLMNDSTTCIFDMDEEGTTKLITCNIKLRKN